MWSVVNGAFVHDPDAVVSVHDRGFRYGDGVFDTLRVYAGTPFLLDRHLDRLLRGAAFLGIAPLPTASDLARTIHELVHRNGAGNSLVRTTLTRGISPGWPPMGAGTPTLVIIERPFAGHPEALYITGMSVAVLTDLRLRPAALAPTVKSLSLLAHVQAQREAAARGADDAVLCAEGGGIAETTTGNVFCLRNGQVLTPALSEGILAGITREIIVDVARDEGLAVQQTRISPDELRGADEVFVTGTGVEVLPVTRVDGRVVGSGHPGVVATMLRRKYRERVEKAVGTRPTGNINEEPSGNDSRPSLD